VSYNKVNANGLHLLKDKVVRMKKKFGWSLLFVLLLVGLTSCTQSPITKSEDNKPIVAVTIVPQETFVKEITGDAVEVITMVPPGSSPETYEPTPQQMVEFNKAALYFTIDMAVEETKVLPNIGEIPVVNLAEAIRKVYPDRMFDEGERDEHIWLSPKRIRVMVETMTEELVRLMPEKATDFRQNSEVYLKDLTNLDKELTAIFAEMEPKIFIVYHPAFGYIAKDFGLEMVALEEEGKESTPQQLQKVVDLAKIQGIKTIFYQQEVDSRQATSFAEEIKGVAVQLSPLSADYIENMKVMAKAIAEARK
jgi:zinc transport system substrate-binding protein